MIQTLEELADERMRGVGEKEYPLKDLDDPKLMTDPRKFPREIQEELADGDVYARMQGIKFPEDAETVNVIRFLLDLAYRMTLKLEQS